MKIPKSLRVAVIVVSILLLLPVIYIGKYDRPSADDYDYSYHTHEALLQGGGPVALIKAAHQTNVQQYYVWQGIYTSSFIFALQPGIFGEKYYALTPLILVAIIFACFFFIFRILDRRLRLNAKLPYSLLATAVVALGIPFPVQGLYWFNGATHYMLWLMVTLLNLAILYDFSGEDRRGRRIGLIALSCALSFLISGGSQVTAFLNILLLLCVTVALLIRRRSFLPAFSLAVAVLGFLFSYFAPGTAARQASIQATVQQAGVVETCVQSLYHVFRYLLKWINIPYICILLLFLPLSAQIVKRAPDSSLFRNPLWSMLVSLVILTGLFCVPYYAMSGFGGGRIFNVFWIVFMVFSVVNMTLVCGWLTRRYGQERLRRLLLCAKPTRRKLWLVTTVCFAMLFSSSAADPSLFSTSAEAVLEVVRGSAQRYAAECDARYAVLNDPAVQDAVLKPLQEKPDLLFFLDYEPDSAIWPNVSTAKYYHKNSVRISDKAE